MKLYHSIRERFQLLLYSSRTIALNTLRIISIVSSVIGIGLMVYYHGFEHSSAGKMKLLFLLKGLFFYYVTSYFIRFLYTLNIKTFLRENWFESLLMLILAMDVGLFVIFKVQFIVYLFSIIGLGEDVDLYGIVLELYLFLLIAIEVGKTEINLTGKKVNPAVLFIIIFAGIIFAGTGLLMLPEMTRPVLENGELVNKSMNAVDAFFTSTSAACVTGLMVEDTMSFFTFKGQMVLLFLVKIGGLNIVAFGLFFALFSRFGVQVAQHEIIEDIVNKETFNSAKGFFGRILLISIAIELVGAVLLFVLLPNTAEVASITSRIHFSIFHSVSAFNNAGISLYQGGLGNPAIASAYPVLCVMTGIIFIGTMGFLTILDVINISALKERINKPWKKIDLGTKVGLLSNTHLLIIGTVLFLILEWNSSIVFGQNTIEKTITAVFQVVNRTAGFNSVDTGSLGIPMILVMIMLMFIGGSSSSTAGGVKTSTVTLLFVSVYTTIRGKKNAELFGKNISKDLLLKAYAVVLFAISNIFLWSFLLSITESSALQEGRMTILELIFELVSAFSTVGLSMGITSEVSPIGLIILSVAMFIGRLGTLMLLMALSKQVGSTRYKYPDAHLMIG